MPSHFQLVSHIIMLQNRNLIVQLMHHNNNYAYQYAFSPGFAQRPMSLTLAIGERAIFTCQHCATNAIIWRLDGIKLRYNSLPPGIISSYIYPEVQSLCGVIYLLTIKQIVAHNNTMISCEANINSRVPNEASDSALLLTQGKSCMLCFNTCSHNTCA